MQVNQKEWKNLFRINKVLKPEYVLLNELLIVSKI